MTEHSWADLIGRFLAHLTRTGARPDTVKLRRTQLRRLARELDVEPLKATLEQLDEWLTSHLWIDSTARSHRVAVRTFYRWIVDVEQLLLRSPAVNLHRVAEAQIGPRRLPASDIAVARVQRARDRRVPLMAELGLRLGLRRGEISRVDREDLFRDLVGWSLLVKGKGGRRRIVPVPDATAAKILAAPPGPLFPGKIDGRLSPTRVGELLSEAMPVGESAHNLRHRRATIAYEETGRDARAVQELLGHASLETTQRYVHANAHQLRRAVGGPL